MLKTILVIIPAYNESDNIPDTYLELASLSRMIDRYRLKIVFVNDCSSDNTLEVLKKIKEENPDIGIIDVKERSGEWVAFKIALASFDSDYAVQLPADLQIPCSIIKKFTKKIEDNKKLDVVYGEGYPHGNGIFSAIYWSWLFFRFTGKLINRQVDIFLINKKIIDSILRNSGYCNIVPLEIFKSSNCDVVAFDKNPRKFGISKYNLKSKIKMFAETILLSLSINIFRYKKPEYEILNSTYNTKETVKPQS
jgi:glycosyltransferase involved in cell wall biosynthesis